MLLLRDRRSELETAQVSPFGISRDSPWSHIAWRQALDLDIPLLSDWNGDATREFGIEREHRGLHDVPERSAFLIDAHRVIRFARVYETSEVPDLDELVAAGRSLA